MLCAALGLSGAAATLPGTVELATLTVGSLRAKPRPLGDARAFGRLAVVVPAHDEEQGIARCVRSLLACDAPPSGARVFVVADNCEDRTAQRARDAGAEVIERFDLARRGKGYALELAFAHVLKDPSVEGVLVVDADTTVAPDFLRTMAAAFASGADGVQCRYLVANPEAHRLRHVALLAFNVARPRAREHLGVSVGILGNGFGLHRRVLEALPLHGALGRRGSRVPPDDGPARVRRALRRADLGRR